MSIFSATEANNQVDAFLNGIPYTHASGMKLVQVDPGKASLILPGRPEWTGDSHRQLIHPGCSSVLADTTAGVAVATALDKVEPFATLDLRMDYLRPATAGADLICHAHCHRVAPSIAFVRGEVCVVGQDEPIATVSAAFMRATSAKRREAPPASPAPASQMPTPATAAAGADPSASFTTVRGGGLVSPTSLAAQGPETSALPPGAAPYVEYLDVRRTMLTDGTPLLRLPFRQDLIGNPMLPALHGGVLAGFAETALVLHLVFTNKLNEQFVPKGVDFLIDYLRSARPVDTFAHCTTVRQGSRVALVQVSLWQEDPTRPVAVARGHLLLPKDA